MPSVTYVTSRVSQPRLGFLPINKFKTENYHDGSEIDTDTPSYSSNASIQGIAVDYLTRMICGFDKREAFKVSLLGAKKVNELNKANELLKKINGLDRESIINACKIVGYDVVVRRRKEYFTNIDFIMPDDSIINNISIMVKRGVKFIKSKGDLISVGFTFEGGYTSLIDSGDGDYLTSKEIWDFKTSLKKPDSKDTLQLLVYYILGYHSQNELFKKISTIGFFNPLRNESYYIDVSRISDDVLRTVSHEVIGYKVKEKPYRWYEIEGEDNSYILNKYLNKLKDRIGNGFDPDYYDDGIYDITVDDYWTFIKDKLDIEKPKFTWTDHIKFLKHDGYIMFISVSKKGRLSLLRGGKLKHIERDLQYYYNNLPTYGEKVLQTFSKYWDELYAIKNYLSQLKPDKKILKQIVNRGEQGFINYDHFEYRGRVHGCIVDIDYYNHIYLNPFDGSITPYYARSIYQKHVYQNVESLLTEQRPDLLPDYKRTITNSSLMLLADPNNSLVLTSSEKNNFSEIVYDTSMYGVSNKLRPLQHIYDFKMVTVWYDSFLPQTKTLTAPDINSPQKQIRYEKKFKLLFSIKRDEKDKTDKEHRFLIWETNMKISELDLLYGIEKFIDKIQKENDYCNDTIMVNCSWIPLKGFNSTSANVQCTFNDAFKSIMKVLRAKDEYPEIVLLKYVDYNKTKKIRIRSIGVVFCGGKNDTVLSVHGDFNYKDGELIMI